LWVVRSSTGETPTDLHTFSNEGRSQAAARVVGDEAEAELRAFVGCRGGAERGRGGGAGGEELAAVQVAHRGKLVEVGRRGRLYYHEMGKRRRQNPESLSWRPT
jgi:hypothetical protein